jgi:putative membrane protein insertion efficiency factor
MSNRDAGVAGDRHPLGATVALGLIKAYQYGIRPMLGQRCRFFPSCSEYTAEAIGAYGVFRGGLMGAARLGKCHPWHTGGYDPVPQRVTSPSQPVSAAPVSGQRASPTSN